MSYNFDGGDEPQSRPPKVEASPNQDIDRKSPLRKQGWPNKVAASKIDRKASRTPEYRITYPLTEKKLAL